MTAPTSEYAIDLHHVEKTYRGGVRALLGIEMQVHPGEIFGLLGPNGAGKSTLVKIMMTVVRPSRITGSLLGRPVGNKATLARVGYLPEHHRLPGYLTGRQVMEFYAAMAKVRRSVRKKRADELLDVVGMADWATTKVSAYSKGMLQRIGLGQTLMNDPDLVLLDEPTDGVDPVGRRDIRDVLIRLREQGKTVFINSHLLNEVEMVCDRVAILVQGRVATQGTIDALTAESQRYEIQIDGDAPTWASETDTLRVDGESNDITTLILKSAEAAAVQPVIDRLRRDDRTVIAVNPVRETLEDLFMRAVTDPDTGQIHKPGATTNRLHGKGGKR